MSTDAQGGAGSAQGATQLFESLHGRAPQGVWASPGRVNLIGEHTDYNEGFVLPLAIRQRCVVAASAADASAGSSVTSAQRPGETIRFTAATVSPGDVDGWAAYVAGVLWALREAGHVVGELDLVVDSTVPLGASLSSSAAIECAVAAAAAGLVGIDLDATQIALLAQRAENDFVGMPCGVMDQMASMHGKPGQLVFIDTRSLAVENVPFDLSGHGLALLVIDTRAPHALVDGEYAARRRDCEQAAQRLGVPALRDITGAGLDDALARLDGPDDETMRKRVRHVVTEDDRVLEVVQVLRSGTDPRAIGPMLNASHASMRDDFEITVPHVDVAVDTALSAGAVGARMTGGGFGGSIIALVEQDAAESIAQAVAGAYAERGWEAPAPFVTRAEQGATRLA